MNNSPNAQPGQCLYVSDAQKAIVAEVSRYHISIQDIENELLKLSTERKTIMMEQIRSWASEQTAKQFEESWITIPTFNHLMIRELDACQLHCATMQVALANQSKHVINLLVAAQQTLVDLHVQQHGNVTITPHSATQTVQEFTQTDESMHHLQAIFMDNLRKYVNIKTTYTFDTRLQGFFVTPPATNTMIKVPGETPAHATTMLFSPVVETGEDYSLAGLTTIATHYMRNFTLPNVAHAVATDPSIDSDTKASLLTDIRANMSSKKN